MMTLMNFPSCITVGELCYPFSMNPNTETVENKQKEIKELYKKFHNFSSTPNGCDDNGICFCADNHKVSESKYSKPLLCTFNGLYENESFKHVNSIFKDSWIQTTSDCSGKCYRFNGNSFLIDQIALFLKNANDGVEVFPKSDILAAASNGVGICLPEHKCQSQIIGLNEVKKKMISVKKAEAYKLRW